ncbi:MAG: hypothetical protein ACYCW6_28295 [Candidatus Xenobia bacterium]
MNALQPDSCEDHNALAARRLLIRGLERCVRVRDFLNGLYQECCTRHSPVECLDIVEDMARILHEAGVPESAFLPIGLIGQIVFTETREWECLGEEGTLPLVREHRDYTRQVVGEEIFQQAYRGLQTLDGKSYYCTAE